MSKINFNRQLYRLRGMIMLALVILFASLASSQSANDPLYLGQVKQYDSYDIHLTCTLSNGSLCVNSAPCNVSFLNFPNGSFMFKQRPMTFSSGIYNLTVPQTSILGNYYLEQVCCSNGLCATQGFNYDVTPSGVLLKEGESTIVIATMITAFIIAIILFILGLFIQTRPIKLIFYAFSAVFVIGGALFTQLGIESYIANNAGLQLVYARFIFLLGTFGVVLLVGLMVYALIFAITYMRNRARFSGG